MFLLRPWKGSPFLPMQWSIWWCSTHKNRETLKHTCDIRSSHKMHGWKSGGVRFTTKPFENCVFKRWKGGHWSIVWGEGGWKGPGHQNKKRIIDYVCSFLGKWTSGENMFFCHSMLFILWYKWFFSFQDVFLCYFDARPSVHYEWDCIWVNLTGPKCVAVSYEWNSRKYPSNTFQILGNMVKVW